MTRYFFPIIALTATLMASCSSDNPILESSGERPYITITAEDAQDVDSSLDSRSEAMPDTVFTMIRDGKAYTIEVETEPLSKSQDYSRARYYNDFSAFRIWSWMRQNAANSDGYHSEIIYMDDADARKMSDENIWKITPRMGNSPFGYPDENIDGYRWPGINSVLAFMAISPLIPSTDEDMYEHRPMLTVPSTTRAKVSIEVNFENDCNYDLAMSTCRRNGDYYSSGSSFNMRFHHLTAAIQINVQKTLFKGYAFQSVNVTKVKSQGIMDFYPETIWNQGQYTNRIFPALTATGRAISTWIYSENFSSTDRGSVPETAPQIDRDETATLPYLPINYDHLLYIIPQTAPANATIQIKMTNKDAWAEIGQRQYETFDIDISGLTFDEGKKYIFNVTSAGSNVYPNPAN